MMRQAVGRSREAQGARGSRAPVAASTAVAAVTAVAALAGATGCRTIFGLDDPGLGGGPAIDAAIDAADPQRLCWGSEFEICLPAPPAQAGSKTLAGTVDTSTSSLCEASLSVYCVVAANTLTVGMAAVTGGRPLVLIGADSIVVEGALDAASHAGKAGPAAMAASCGPFAAPPTNGRGGGAGGTLGGIGGVGGNATDNAIGGKPAPVGTPSGLRAGCRGQDGGGAATHGGVGGLGGGAAYLIAGRAIEVRAGAKVNASGAAGSGALCTGDCAGSMGDAGGGGGGGSGGMLILEAPSISSAGFIFADGGGAGEGASGSNSGRVGTDPDGTKSAPGGIGGASNGGNGGNGSYGAVASGGVGEDADSSVRPPGGGGGGGGAGVVRIYGTAGIAGGTVSPPPQPR
jgi:hypothetical protein